MQIINKILIVSVAFCCALCDTNTATAQRYKRKSNKITINDSINRTANRYADSLALLKEEFKEWEGGQNEMLSNPYFYPLFSPTTFSSQPVKHAMVLAAAEDEKTSFATETLITDIYSALNFIYTTQPWYISHNEQEASKGVIKDFGKEIKPEVKLAEKTPLKENDMQENFADHVDIVVHRPNFWNFKYNVSLKFMQTYISDNWYKGGESNNSWLSKVYIEANYNNKQKVEWNNSLEMKLGFQSSSSDKKHKFKANEDLIRMINKLGFRATKHWYYSLGLQSWTQFYRGFHSNDDKVYSDFMSPFQSDLSVGMEYKLNTKKFNMTATIAPATCRFKYVDRKYLSPNFGVNANKHAKFELGSSATINCTWNVAKNISWRARIYYYTDYDKSQIEWENTINLKINKFLATELFLYPRFDDSAKRNKKNSYLQFRELLSVGLDLYF